MSEENEESEFWNASERHHQIMMEGDRFVKRIVWGCLGVLVLAAGFVIFFLFKFHPFWKYP